MHLDDVLEDGTQTPALPPTIASQPTASEIYVGQPTDKLAMALSFTGGAGLFVARCATVAPRVSVGVVARTLHFVGKALNFLSSVDVKTSSKLDFRILNANNRSFSLSASSL